MTDMGTNTSDVVIEPTVGVLRTPHTEANTQTSIPTVEMLIPHVLGDNTMIPHISLSISSYEPDSLRTPGIKSPPVRVQEVSMIPQLDGPGSLPIRDHTRGRMGRFSDQGVQDPSQGGTCVQRASTIRRIEYPGGESSSDDYRRPHRDQRPPDRGGYPGGCPPDGGGGSPDGGRPPGLPGGQGPPDPQGPPGPVRWIIVQTPQVTLDVTTLENTFDTVEQSMMQLARAKIKPIGNCSSIYNRDKPTCKSMWGSYNNWLPKLIRETLIIYLLVFLYMMEAIEKASFLSSNF